MVGEALLRQAEAAWRDSQDMDLPRAVSREATQDLVGYLIELIRQETEHTLYCTWCKGSPPRIGEPVAHAPTCPGEHAVRTFAPPESGSPSVVPSGYVRGP